MTGTHAPTSARPPFVRRRQGRLLGGVATGISEHLGVPVVAVRVGFALLSVNGIGGLAYLALWLLVPPDTDTAEPWTFRRLLHEAVDRAPDDVPHRRAKVVGYVLLGTAAVPVLVAMGLPFGGNSLGPLSIAGLGALLIWWRAPEGRRERWATGARRATSRLGQRRDVLIVVGGVALVVVGVASFLAANDALAQARDGALAIAATLVGVLLVAGPWLLRLVRDLTRERTARIREQERAEVAAHLHDSVLQTLALIQAQAGDADGVRRLARGQERELRQWLYGAPSATAVPTLAGALRDTAAEVEDLHAVTVEVVVVGDAPLDDGLRATLAAAREAMVNAAKSSGANAVSVFGEVTPDRVEVFVRDRGHGFDLASVPDDRRGIRDSIVARMARHGGAGTVRTGPGGTEVALSLPRPTS